VYVHYSNKFLLPELITNCVIMSSKLMTAAYMYFLVPILCMEGSIMNINTFFPEKTDTAFCYACRLFPSIKILWRVLLLS
jgi:hypothetical protein